MISSRHTRTFSVYTVFLAAGAIYSSGNNITLGGDTIFTHNTAVLNGGEPYGWMDSPACSNSTTNDKAIPPPEQNRESYERKVVRGISSPCRSAQFSLARIPLVEEIS